MTTDAHQRMSRRLLAAYLVIVFALSYALEATIISRGGLDGPGGKLTPILMWVPGVVAVAMRLLWRRRLSPLGFKRPRIAWLGFGYLFPAGVALAAYGIAWLTGLAPLSIPWDRIEAHAPGAAGLALFVLVAGGVAFIGAAILALGEEIGWRGFLVPLLVGARVPYPLAVSGIIWGLWHVPLVLFGDYASSQIPIVSAAVFIAATTADGVNYGWTRLASRSLWPAVFLHASHNAYFQTVFDKLTGESATSAYVVGESGLLPLALYGAFAIWLVRSGRTRKAAESFTADSGAAQDSSGAARDSPGEGRMT